MNPSGIWPVEFKVVIEPIKVEEKIGSILLPEQTKDKEQFAVTQGYIVAVSPFAFNYVTTEEWAQAGVMKPKPGDKVYFAKYAGGRMKGKDGKEYLLLNDKDVGAKIEE